MFVKESQAEMLPPRTAAFFFLTVVLKKQPSCLWLACAEGQILSTEPPQSSWEDGLCLELQEGSRNSPHSLLFLRNKASRCPSSGGSLSTREMMRAR